MRDFFKKHDIAVVAILTVVGLAIASALGGETALAIAGVLLVVGLTAFAYLDTVEGGRNRLKALLDKARAAGSRIFNRFM